MISGIGRPSFGVRKKRDGSHRAFLHILLKNVIILLKYGKFVEISLSKLLTNSPIPIDGL